MNEFELVELMKQRSKLGKYVKVGIGDDAAVISSRQGKDLLLTTDMLMDTIDFIVGKTDPYLIGRKAMAVNLSDIAAMGGTPLAALVSVAIPRGTDQEILEKLQTGIYDMADKFDVSIVGGDTNSWEKPLVISITVLGETSQNSAVLRSRAQEGDLIFVTGDLGGSIKGKHLTFTPRIKEAISLCRSYKVSSMIDLSDGLASDLRHILCASNKGAIIKKAEIPIAKEAIVPGDNSKSITHALTDGEDFELCFSMSKSEGERLLANPPFIDPKITEIGVITLGQDVFLEEISGVMELLDPKIHGFRHEIS